MSGPGSWGPALAEMWLKIKLAPRIVSKPQTHRDYCWVQFQPRLHYLIYLFSLQLGARGQRASAQAARPVGERLPPRHQGRCAPWEPRRVLCCYLGLGVKFWGKSHRGSPLLWFCSHEDAKGKAWVIPWVVAPPICVRKPFISLFTIVG